MGEASEPSTTVGSADPETVGLPGYHAGHKAVSRVAVTFGQHQPRLDPIGVEQAQGNFVTARRDCEVRTVGGGCGAQRVRAPGAEFRARQVSSPCTSRWMTCDTEG